MPSHILGFFQLAVDAHRDVAAAAPHLADKHADLATSQFNAGIGLRAEFQAMNEALGAEARLCGPEADPYPLAVSVLPKGSRPVDRPAPVAPVLSVRHASDDLCIRFWTL